MFVCSSRATPSPGRNGFLLRSAGNHDWRPSRSIHWRLLPRARLCQIGREHRGLINAGLTSVVQMPDAHAEDEVRASGLMADYLPITEFSKFRYQIDIDGNTSSWPGLFQKLLTGCPVLKVASPRGFRQWYYERLKPWINFVPVATDMSDLADKIAWLRDHDDAARAIGAQGQALVLSMDYEGELMRAGRTVTAALRHFACQSATELRFGLRGVESACLQDGGGPCRCRTWCQLGNGREDLCQLI